MCICTVILIMKRIGNILINMLSYNYVCHKTINLKNKKLLNKKFIFLLLINITNKNI